MKLKNIPSDRLFKLHACCIPIRGYGRSIIYDLNRKKFWYIPNDLYDVLLAFDKKTIKQLFQSYNSSSHSVLHSYLAFLVKNEFIFFCDKSHEAKRFPKIDLSFDSPALITNAIVQIENRININIKRLINELNDLGCRHIQIALFSESGASMINSILEQFDKSAFRSIEILLKYSSSLSEEELKHLIKRHPRISQLIVFESPREWKLKSPYYGMHSITFSGKSITPLMNNPISNISSFRVNIDLFCETQIFNPYFNRKMVIDSKGNIKNAPNSYETFGNVNDTSLSKIAKQKKFQILWKVKKDDISVCKKCEYRYMCVDNRIPIKLGNKWVHKTQCLYNVYKSQWRNKKVSETALNRKQLVSAKISM